MDNKNYLLALNKIPQLGPRTVKKLLMHWPNLEEMFRQPQQLLIKAGLSEPIAMMITKFDMRNIEDDLLWQESHNHHLLTWSDPNYPTLLAEIHDPPVVLYAQGQLSALKNQTVAMVGTRKPSFTGREIARRFAFNLAKHNITIVSGLALGIDAEAHLGCIQANGQTIAVMGTGIDQIYPLRHRQLADQIVHNGLLLSEFPLKTPPLAGHFPRRNRIISGLSLSTLVVEAAIRSGSLITARMALEQNRDVLAIPGSINLPQARGCHALLQQGAKLVTSVDDVLNELPGSIVQNKNHLETEECCFELASTNGNLVKCIGAEVTTVDQIIMRSNLSLEYVVCELAKLEIEGMIKAVPGGYVRCLL